MLTASPQNRYLDLLKQTNSPVLGIKSHNLDGAKRKADSWAALHGLNSCMVGLEEVLTLSDIQRYGIPVEL